MRDEINTVSTHIKLINELIEKKANQKLKIYGITVSQIRVVIVLKAAKNETCSMKELEKTLKMSQQNIVGLVKRLEEKKFLYSFADKEDKRIKHVKLTDSGNQLCGTIAFELKKMDEWILGTLTEQEKENFSSLLKKIYSHVMGDSEYSSQILKE